MNINEDDNFNGTNRNENTEEYVENGVEEKEDGVEDDEDDNPKEVIRNGRTGEDAENKVREMEVEDGDTDANMNFNDEND